MFLLDWRLARRRARPAALLRLADAAGRRGAAPDHRRCARDQLADISALVEESLSVSGILLGKTMGRSGELAERFERESAELADLEVRSRMAGRWRMASVQITFAAMPALIYLFAGLSIAERRAGDHDRDPGRLHDAPDADVLPDPVAALGRRRRAELAGAVRAGLRLPRRAGRDPRSAPARRDSAERGAGRGDVRRRRLPLRGRRPTGRCATSTSRCPPGPRSRSSARRARARRPSRTCSPGSMTRRRAR